MALTYGGGFIVGSKAQDVSPIQRIYNLTCGVL